MRLVADLDAQTLRLELPDLDAAAGFLDQAERDGGFLLHLSQAPKPFATFALTAVTDGGAFVVSWESRVVQIFDRGGEGVDVAFQFDGWPSAKRQELERQRGGARTAEEGEVAGSSPAFRIQQMNPAQKARLAFQAGRTERRILRRESSPQVLTALLANPRIEAEDVLHLVQSAYAHAGLLKRIAEDRRWAANQEIRTAIVRNPKTPSPLAIRLLDTLRTEDLRQMAKMGALRENVRGAALRVYMKRQGQR